MRIKSEIFVQSLMRAHSSSGGFSSILNKGAQDAGAIFFCHLRKNGRSDFYGQAPQSLIEDGNASERYFELLDSDLSEKDVREKINAQLKFDADCWVVEFEGETLPSAIQIVALDI